MPRRKQPPRLAIRAEADGRKLWVIRDGQRYRRTGCAEDQVADAGFALQEYLAHKRSAPDTSQRAASKVRIADILIFYLDIKEAAIARPRELRSRVRNLNEFWGGLVASDIKGDACRLYVKKRGARIAARRELETLRAAVKLYKKECGLDVEPAFTLPENHRSRERWLTRAEAARLLWVAWRSQYHRHVARFILIGLYTGTRHQATLALQWMANTTGGWADVDKGVLYRRGLGQRESNKRRPPTRLPPRLLAHLRRWHRLDGGRGVIVRYGGERMSGIGKAFRGVRRLAGLSADVTPHVLRHTRCTWLAQAGVPIWEAAGSVGMTAEQFEATYGHHHPDFQKRAAEAY